MCYLAPRRSHMQGVVRVWAACSPCSASARLQHACRAELRTGLRELPTEQIQMSSFHEKKDSMLRKTPAPTWSQNGTNNFQANYSLCSTTHCTQPRPHRAWALDSVELCPVFPFISCLTMDLLLHLSEPHLSKWRLSQCHEDMLMRRIWAALPVSPTLLLWGDEHRFAQGSRAPGTSSPGGKIPLQAQHGYPKLHTSSY